MKKILSLLLTILLLLPLAASAVTAPETPQTVSVVFTNDIHSHLEGENGVGGFARLKTVIDRERDHDPNTIVVDAGDFSMGTLFQTIYTVTTPELLMLGKLGYNAVTLGNHEFDYRTKGLADMLNAAKSSGESFPPVVISNIDRNATMAKWNNKGDITDLLGALFSVGSDVMWIDYNGLKVLVFGLMGKQADSYAPESGVIFSDPIETAKTIVSKHGVNADMIICLSHSGTSDKASDSEDEQLAKAVPEIDFIVSAHTHTVIDEPIVVGNTTIGSAGEFTDYAGTVTFERSGDRWKVQNYQLVALDESVAEDAEVLRDVAAYRLIADASYFAPFGYSLDDVLAYNPYEFTSIGDFAREQGGDTLGDLIADSLIYAVKEAEGDDYVPIDVSIVPMGVVRGTLPVGDVTAAAAFNISSVGSGPDGTSGYPLVSVYFTGAELKTIAEIDASVSDLMLEARLYTSGLQYTFNTNRLFLNRVTDVKLHSVSDVENGGTYVTSEIDNDALYRVVGDLYSCQMMGEVESQSFGLLKVTPKDADGNPIEDFEKHIITMEGGAELKAWYALASYIDSFEDDEIPAYYNREPNDRKIVSNSWNIIELLKAPNKIFFIAAGIVLLVLLLVVLAVVFVVKRARRRKNV